MMPTELFEKAYGGLDISPEEDEIFRAHPEVGAGLISSIPRLEVIAEMIRRQHVADADKSTTEPSRQGALMLQLALELDRNIYQDVDCRTAIAQLQATGRFNGRMLDALDGYLPTKGLFELRQLLIRELRSGMVLDEDVFTAQTNLLVFMAGMVLKPLWIERLGNFARTSGIQERVRVRVPKLIGIKQLSKLGVVRS